MAKKQEHTMEGGWYAVGMMYGGTSVKDFLDSDKNTILFGDVVIGETAFDDNLFSRLIEYFFELTYNEDYPVDISQLLDIANMSWDCYREAEEDHMLVEYIAEARFWSGCDEAKRSMPPLKPGWGWME